APALHAAGGAVPAAGALPRYVRDKVAQTTAERAAAREAAAATAPPSAGGPSSVSSQA
ncbi:tRNA (adenosine(37)-N6)-threonylcarbamoyltransferase complex dimerization subunit type 1 TsaB, partial [Acidovorax sp. PRC11]|nr:tRNA (adenosine(37)-N6)-threonylcarbamoyltransferase complex dimerization subunit type 1 TsaB [Acidovorax sp. PRC11]